MMQFNAQLVQLPKSKSTFNGISALVIPAIKSVKIYDKRPPLKPNRHFIGQQHPRFADSLNSQLIHHYH